MLADSANLRIHLGRIGRVPVLHCEAVGVVDKGAAIWHVAAEQGPEEISCDDGLGEGLAGLDDGEEGVEGAALRVLGRPVVFADEVDFVGAFGPGDVLEEFGGVRGVVVVGEDVDGGDGEVGLVETVGSVHDELSGSEFFDVGGYFGGPFYRDILITWQVALSTAVLARKGKVNAYRMSDHRARFLSRKQISSGLPHN